MSQVARVFVVLNLLVAAGFLFTASTFLAVNQDYKTKLEAEKEAHAKTQGEFAAKVEQFTNDLAEAERVRQNAREQKAVLETENGRLTTQINAMTAQLSTKDTQISELTNNLSKLEEDVQRQGTFVAKLTKDRDDAFADARSAREGEKTAQGKLLAEENKNRDLSNQVAELNRNLVAANEKIGNLDNMITFARSKGISFGNLLMMKRVNGAVTAADNNEMIAMISVGKNKGVQRGYVFDVVRGSDYVGRIEVDEVYPNSAACTIKLLAQGAMIQPADIVTTSLN